MDEDQNSSLKHYSVVQQLLEQYKSDNDGNLCDNEGDIGASSNDINPAFLSTIKDVPDVKHYIELLHRVIIIQQKRIEELKTNILQNGRNIQSDISDVIDPKIDIGVQTEDVIFCSPDCSCEKRSAPLWSSVEGKDSEGPTEKSIAEQVKEAAEHAMQQTGFVYEETSGMYYDYSTGYYYNAELGLYYDGNKGIYYYYDESSHTFQFHSQAEIDPESLARCLESKIEEKKRKAKDEKKKKVKRKAVPKEGTDITQNDSDSIEEGECMDSSEADDESQSSSEADQMDSEEDNVPSKEWPPCMRIIVKETDVKGLKIGTLFIVTCTGGTLGREGDHAVSIPDINISKHHGKFTYEMPEDGGEGKYYISDFGSRNGTYLNGERLSVAKQESTPQEVVHGSIVQVGSTKLLCHIHKGSETCGHCEPGLVQRDANNSSSPSNSDEHNLSSYTSKEQHKKELKRLKKKFGLESSEPNMSAISVSGYEDRAHSRRQTVGSSDHHVKTETASMDEAIRSDNKGYELLSRMGWSKGQALGKEGTGLTEPVPVVARRPLAGLGSGSAELGSSLILESEPVKRKRLETLQKTKERYESISQK